MRPFLLIAVMLIGMICVFTSLSGEEGKSCIEYAELVCDICGDNSDICYEILEKSQGHPHDAACEKGLKMLPDALKNASEEDKKRILDALCYKKIS